MSLLLFLLLLPWLTSIVHPKPSNKCSHQCWGRVGNACWMLQWGCHPPPQAQPEGRNSPLQSPFVSSVWRQESCIAFQMEGLSWSESRPFALEVNAGRLVEKSWTCSQLSLRWEVEKRGKFWQALLVNRALGRYSSICTEPSQRRRKTQIWTPRVITWSEKAKS